ncbi:MAG: Na/Pi cotransporter family protein [Oscillospiraceae bacterium]|jgi:phosphate:Na+ symporter|nr:Na/Pi cotransporter family protein [Oscillospiraceae bacterium]
MGTFDIFSILTLIGGLAFFLYGMSTMSAGLEKMVGSKLDGVLSRMTSNRFLGLLLGLVITAVIQSSSAVTVMLVGLVNSGIMKFSQSISVIIGSNIGTTVTAWILSLSGIEGDNVFVKLLKPESFTPILALIGIIFISFLKNRKKKNVGTILMGFALLMSGMSMMSGALKPLAEMPAFRNVLTAFSNPLLGLLAGIVVTAVIQSSSASVGILQSIAKTGVLPFGTAIPIIMGQNIGTCVTALISSVGANKKAKSVTAAHILFNVIGTGVLLSGYLIADAIFDFAFTDTRITMWGIAIVHSAFNVATTVLVFPFAKQIAKLARRIVGSNSGDEVEYQLLDERLLATPGFAIAECRNVTAKMAAVTKTSILAAVGLLGKYDLRVAEEIESTEKEIDMYEDKLGSYLVKLSARELSIADSNQTAELLHAIGDFERIGDHASNLVEVAREINEKKMFFSDDAMAELRVLTDAVVRIVNLTFEAFENNDTTLAVEVEPLEQVIDKLKREVKTRHVKRLQSGKCTIELGFVWSDILTNFERVSDHCSNIAVYILQTRYSEIEQHEYLGELKSSDDADFMASYRGYRETYRLPANTAKAD